jgi:hypothetical protein
MAVGYLTDVMIHSSKNYHFERGTELRRLRLSQSIWRCAVAFPRRFFSVEVVIRGGCEMVQRQRYTMGVNSVVMWAGC